ncbi:MAG: hypothetical protein EB127_09900 [Alphaproteobacteria bacterium]|nr:hypothetical protein [Alphaproteobacteria bacterium]
METYIVYIVNMSAIFSPCLCGGMGALFGLMATVCFSINTCLPVIIGSGIGGGLGCIHCVSVSIMEWREPELPIAQPVDPIVVQNIYIMYTVGQEKI